MPIATGYTLHPAGYFKNSDGSGPYVMDAAGTATLLSSAGSSSSSATYADASGSIATANTSQQVAPAFATRRGFFFQNQSTGDLYLNYGAPATIGGGSIKVPAGGLYESPQGGAPATTITVIGATQGQAYTAKVY